LNDVGGSVGIADRTEHEIVDALEVALVQLRQRLLRVQRFVYRQRPGWLDYLQLHAHF